MNPELDAQDNVITPSGGTKIDAMSMSMSDSTQDHTECREGNAAAVDFINTDISQNMFEQQTRLNSATGSDRTITVMIEDFHTEFLELRPLTGVAIVLSCNSSSVNVNYSGNIKFFESDTRI